MKTSKRDYYQELKLLATELGCDVRESRRYEDQPELKANYQPNDDPRPAIYIYQDACPEGKFHLWCAHELGHHRQHLEYTENFDSARDPPENTFEDFRKALYIRAHVGAEPLDNKQRELIMLFEVDAWLIAAIELRSIGFENWNELEWAANIGLGSYERELGRDPRARRGRRIDREIELIPEFAELLGSK